MEPLLDIIIGILAHFGWRMWICLISALVIACLFVGYHIAVFWRYDVALLVLLAGLGTGAIWEARSGELPHR